MKTLLILRHAKSSWSDETLSDHDRPLNDRGKRDAPEVGKLMRKLDLMPDVIQSSTAKRARKTAAKVAANCGYKGEIRELDELYLAPPSAYRDTLRRLPDDVQTAMVVGHNPGLEELLAETIGRHEHLPTAALAQISLEIDHWSEVHSGMPAKLIGLWRPRDSN